MNVRIGDYTVNLDNVLFSYWNPRTETVSLQFAGGVQLAFDKEQSAQFQTVFADNSPKPVGKVQPTPVADEPFESHEESTDKPHRKGKGAK